jgi:ADP-heptose:LPS heptosyltransferase
MQNAPILILQMQRMGDLILTFPVMGWLRAAYPDHPIWVVGEETFFETVLRLGPEAVYFPYSAADRLARNRYHLVINVSHRPEAAELAGRTEADAHFGPVSRNGTVYIHGLWQLYRASIVHNNRHNQFHWADLNALDILPPRRIYSTQWPPPRAESGGQGRIGLFLGASEPDKHPDALFWAELASLLLKRDLKPVLLGGAAEAALGRQVAALLKAPSLNLCGRFSLLELSDFLSSVSLLVTPDTGPMHLAAWLGVPTLNLSLGPVNAWETAPAPHGHLVARTSVSCSVCWRCVQSSQRCRASFESSDALLSDSLRRVCQAAVNISAVRERETPSGLRRVLENKRRALIDWNGACAVRGLRLFLPDVYLLRLEAPFACVFYCCHD